MDVGIGLPTAHPAVNGDDVVAWARHAEAGGFSTLGVIDRLVHGSWEPLTALAAAAAVTERIGLATSILIAPLRAGTALLAKQAATVDRLSHGRLTLGLAVGSRPDDFAVGGVELAGRGARTDAQLRELRELWSSAEAGKPSAVGPAPARPGGPPLLLGGHAPRALERAARFGDGWIGGGTGPGMFRGGAEQFRAAWERTGRTGRPRLAAIAYVGLGPGGAEETEAYLRSYYRGAGPFADHIVRNAATSSGRLAELLGEYEEAGCDEVLLMPCMPNRDQIDRAAEAVSAAA
ncbi:LLM class flavin-dependent oxidoreductase [Streptomyces xiaopingdaonensis]|uniref:LLM class flavin-dependent oxidoreductase n=1 Tax=Streptomyces xiaopingdaonensis TaxID=1565415 RepID=UPI0002EB2A64|nr:LLM class flavin-dependent oxidoreductase [Streptomyces xiaopingdaonensis]